jgi:hypothetical protein
MLQHGMNDIHTAVNNAMEYGLYIYCQKDEGILEENDSFMGILFADKYEAFRRGKRLYDKTPSKCPKTSINVDILFDFYKNNKSDFEVVTFLAFAAIRSILQKQAYSKITNQYLLSRMAGGTSKDADLPDCLIPYNNRYQLDKIKTELQLHWGLKLYGNHTRGFYVSFSMDLEDLVYHAEKNRKAYQERQLKNQKKEAAIKAKMKLNNSTEPIIRSINTYKTQRGQVNNTFTAQASAN